MKTDPPFTTTPPAERGPGNAEAVGVPIFDRDGCVIAVVDADLRDSAVLAQLFAVSPALRHAAARLFLAIKPYNIGYEGSELLAAMVEMRIALDASAPAAALCAGDESVEAAHRAMLRPVSPADRAGFDVSRMPDERGNVAVGVAIHAALDAGLEPGQAMAMASMHNALKIMRAIDKDEFVAAGCLEADWEQFRDYPFNWFLSCGERYRAKLWAVIQKRQPAGLSA